MSRIRINFKFGLRRQGKIKLHQAGSCIFLHFPNQTQIRTSEHILHFIAQNKTEKNSKI